MISQQYLKRITQYLGLLVALVCAISSPPEQLFAASPQPLPGSPEGVQRVGDRNPPGCCSSTSTPTPTPTPTRTPPPPEEPLCRHWKFTVNMAGWGQTILPREQLFTPRAPSGGILPRVQEIFGNLHAGCQSSVRREDQYAIDDCVAAHLGVPLAAWNLKKEDLPLGNAQCVAQGPFLGRTSCISWAIYLDENGSPVPAVPSSQICDLASMNFYLSPISLLWDGQGELETSYAIVRFPLSPFQKGESVTWRASGSQPLLVYDPKHEGKIESFEQLFGDWTFGGKTLQNSSNNAPGRESPKAPWANGYEALSTLDQDQSGEIEGSELSPLALWFDRNRDGISQASEVVPARDLGVTRLGYKVNLQAQQGPNIFLPMGFTRRRGDKLESGTLVDWYATSGVSADEIAHRAGGISSFCKTAEIGGFVREQLRSSELVSEREILASLRNPTSGYDGLWFWEPQSASGAVLKSASSKSVGALFLNNQQGQLRGYSVNQFHLEQERRGSPASLLLLSALSGRVQKKSDGSSFVEYSINYADGSTLASEAVLSKDGRSLRGRTLASVQIDGKPHGLHYTWSARKSDL